MPVGDWTLCLGSQGHLALETEDATCAETRHQEQDHAAAENCADCDDCRDVSLQVAVGVWKLDDTATDIGPMGPLPAGSPAVAFESRACADAAGASSSPPRCTRTPILRC